LHCQVPQPADSKHGNTLMRLRIRPAESAIDSVTGAEDRGSLLEGNFVGNQVGGIGIHWHVFRVTALRITPGAFQIGAEHPAAPLAPFAASARGLNPGRAHAVANLTRSDVLSHGDDFADWLVTQDSRKRPWKVSKCLVNVRITDAACAHL